MRNIEHRERAELQALLLEYAHTCRTLLADDFVGLYPLGSLAIGDFDLTSDVDFMIVTNREPNPAQVALIQEAHTSLIRRDSRWVRHLEYSLFPIQELSQKPPRHARTAPRQLWYFLNGASTIERSAHDNTLVTRWTLRYRSTPVLGPEPARFAPEVTADELRQEIRNSMLAWEKLFTPESPFDNRFHQVFFVLNNCRALQDLHEGRITSKREGAEWAKEHLDSRWRSLIDYCWRERQDSGINVTQRADPEAFRETIAFVAYTTRLAAAYRIPNDQHTIR